MMRAIKCLAVAIAALVPATANAACEPGFVEGSNAVTLTPPSSLENQRMVEQFSIRLRNSGSEPCTIQLRVGRNIAAVGTRFPAYSLVGPNGNQPIAVLSGANEVAGFGTEFVIPAEGQLTIPYQIRLSVGWGVEAGPHAEELILQLVDAQSGLPLARQIMRLSLEIPKTARIRFAGATGIDGPPRIDLGPISATATTSSPPFALRILSTSPYRIDLVSQNQGGLRRSEGMDRIPYQLTLSNQVMNLSSGAGSLSVDRHTNSVGDVHPVSIEIQPNPRYHAGHYSDRVTVTVTACC